MLSSFKGFWNSSVGIRLHGNWTVVGNKVLHLGGSF
ncbi:hypothetical protein DBR06_SOUSAS8610082 [Sousa chinensis]|nr:hypothetical protein DBR06_SOUSAS8610082 [Sousa chinensis]